jgi:hypothetical protein
VIGTSPNVSLNNPLGSCEGQFLPEIRGHYPSPPWTEDFIHDWDYIRDVWMKYWDQTKPVLVEKSPPNLIRAASIEQHFSPAFFLCLVRDPYAHAESFIRRKGKTPTDAANFVIYCMRHQKDNVESLKRSMLIRYEDLTSSPRNAADRLLEWLPDLGTLDIDRSFDSYDYRDAPLTNLNEGKISKLNKSALSELNSVFGQHPSLLQYFGYPMR